VPEPSAPGSTITVQSVVRNSTLIFGFQLLTKAAGFVSAVMLANELGTVRFGLFNYGFALTSLFIPFCDMGLDVVLMRDAARHDRNRTAESLAAVLGAKTILGILVFLLVLVVSTFLESTGTESFTVVLLAGAVIILRTFWNSFNAVFRSLNRVRLEAMVFTSARGAEFLVTIVCVLAKSPLPTLLAGLILVNLVAVGATFIFIRFRFFLVRFFFSPAALASALRESLPFALTTIFVSVYFNFDTVLVSKLIGNQAAGIYRAAYNLILPLMMVTAAVTGAVFPFASQNFRSRPEEVAGIIHKSASYLLLAGTLIAVVGFMCADEIVSFLFSEEFRSAGTCLAILIWFIPIVFLTNLFGNVLGAMDEQSFVLRVVIINVIFSVTTDFLLIPRLAQNGASIVTVATEFLGLCLLSYRIRKTTGSILEKHLLPKLACAAALTAGVLALTPHLWLPARLACGTLAFLLVAVSLRAFSARDLRFLLGGEKMIQSS